MASERSRLSAPVTEEQEQEEEQEEQEEQEQEERERVLLTNNKWLAVGKHNALSGNTASARSGSSIWRRVLYPHSPFGHVARICGEEEEEEEEEDLFKAANEVDAEQMRRGGFWEEEEEDICHVRRRIHACHGFWAEEEEAFAFRHQFSSTIYY
jgi:molybdopterin converting factor small subunit